jgi:tetratricopeptide (TPR) repeat protein/DNA polymerase III delta prime subunit
MSSDDLETIFVQREALAEEIVESIRDSVLTQSKHHTLLVGPRGIGKTHLVSIVYHRIKAMEDLKDRYLIAWLREDEWGITSFLDLLLRIFRALLEERNDEILSQRVESFYELTEDIAEQQAELLIKEYVADRTLIVIAENLDDIFDGLGDTGQGKLRSYIQENPFFSILATSQSLFNGVSVRTSPFYGFFLVHHLQELDFEDVVKLLTKIAELKGDQDLASFILTPTGRARVRAVHHLAGGNHRVYIIFSQFLDRKSLDDLVESVMQTLDDLTPYYQSRMQWLSPQQRKIIEFLCNYRGAVAVKEIAGRSFMTQQTASSQLKVLTDYGYVRSTQIGRESYYELREPLMRISSEVKKQRGNPIKLLVEFLRIWFSKAELQEQISLIGNDEVKKTYLIEALKLAESEEDPVIQACLRDLSKYTEKGDLEHVQQVKEELIANGYDERKSVKMDECKTLFVDYGRPCIPASCLRGVVRSYAQELIRDNADIVKIKFWELMCSNKPGHFEEALSVCIKLIELENDRVNWWELRGLILIILKRYSESIEVFNKAIELGAESYFTFFSRAEALLAQNRWKDGARALDNALGQFSSSTVPHFGDTKAILENLLMDIGNQDLWSEYIKSLLDIYRKHNTLNALGQGLVGNIKTLYSPAISDSIAQTWRDMWLELAGKYDEMQIPLRLLDTAVRYRLSYSQKRKSYDQRILLELPIEERKVLEEILEPFMKEKER